MVDRLVVDLLEGGLLPQGTDRPLHVDTEVHQGDQIPHALARDPKRVPVHLALDLPRARLAVLRRQGSVVQDLILVRLAHARVRTVRLTLNFFGGLLSIPSVSDQNLFRR